MAVAESIADAEPTRQDRGIRLVLARLAGTASDTAVLRAAGGIAEVFAAPVTAIHVPLMPPSIAHLAGRGEGDAFIGFGPSEDAASTERATAARSGFEAWLSARGWPESPAASADGPSASYIETDGDEPEILTERARLADVTITARPGSATLEALLIASGRPILLVPDEWSGDLLGGNAVLAWKGSAPAARATAAALPFLRRIAGDAMVFSAPERRHQDAPEEVAAYLRRHGIRSEIAEAVEGDAGRQLLAVARSNAAGFIVCGAFAHGPLRQAVFGGVTTTLIERADLPVLFNG
ncbi:MAG: universal stress protein [Bauldia sp.]